MRRIEDWRARLIDLSRRNNLLYFRRTKRGNLRVSRPAPQTIFNRLILRGGKWEFWLPPEDGLKVSYRPALRSNQLLCEGLDGVEVERVLRNMLRRSLSDYRERGVRILHAAFGMLVWKELETAEEIRSPLILVPIELKRASLLEPFTISVPSVEEEAVLNPALLVRLRKDFKLEIPPLPEDWENQSLTDYLGTVAEAVKDFGWAVEETAEIGFFSFYKLVIFKDLESNAEVIAQHPIIQAIAGKASVDLVQDSLPEEQDIDKIELPERTFQVLDADGSQRVCIDYALRGQSFVMQGPPGTGKSQTIANIIGECMARGKSVLFVSDKMAALEVVYKRLAEIGLAHFCLELHSEKANKREVVAELKRCLDEQLVPRKLPAADEFQKMMHLRMRLNDYVTSLHQNRLPLDRSAYEILCVLSTLDAVPSVPVGLSNPRSLTPQRLLELEELGSRLRNVWQVVEEPDFPWRDYAGSSYDVEIRSELSAFLDNLVASIGLIRSESAGYSSQLGLDAPSTLEQVKWLIGVGDVLADSPKPDPSWVTNPRLDPLISEAKNYLSVFEEWHTIRNSLLECYGGPLFNLPLRMSVEIEKALADVSKLLPTIDPKSSELLAKERDLVAFITSMRDLIKYWVNASTELAQAFGLSIEDLTIERVGQLVRIAALCHSEEKPEASWLDPTCLLQVQQRLPKIKADYQEYNSLKDRLEKIYNKRIYELDLDELILRYRGPYRSPLRWLRPSFHRDRKQIALATHEGMVPKTVLTDLSDARKSMALKAEIDDQAESVRGLLGHLYSGYGTDFGRVERALAVASEVMKIAGVATLPEQLVKLVSFGSAPLATIRQVSDGLRGSMDRLDQAISQLGSLLPLGRLPSSQMSFYQTSLSMLQEWTDEAERRLAPLWELTKDVLEIRRREGPRNYEELLEDLGKAEDVRRKEAEILGRKELLREEFGSRFSGMDTDWREIVSCLEWTRKFQALFGHRPIPQLLVNIVSRGSTAAPSNLELIAHYDSAMKNLAALESRFEGTLTYQGSRLQAMGVPAIQKRLEELKGRIDDLQIWVDFKDVRDRFAQNGLADFFNILTKNSPPASQLVDIFHKGIYQEWINSVYDEDENLSRFRRENHEHVISEFRRIDNELIRLSPNRVMDAANSRKPQEIWVQAKDSEISVLSREAVKKRRLMPIRSLFQEIPNLLFRLKPCMLMSPLSVSQFLGPELMKFDLVLFDEASQIVPEDAIGAIYRGKTIVVAGDNKQLPPTPFFQRSLIDEYYLDEVDEDVENFDSILDECMGIGLPAKTLQWHYRSKHEGLIAFSNHRFYDDRLITFPSVLYDSEAFGVKLVYVPDGVYDRGGRRDNVREAEAVADLVLEHFKLYPEKTLGVVTLSLAQMEAVEEAIERRLKLQGEFERFLEEDRLQGFFVKNLENVQGDERDVIILSIGYGRDQQGRMTMNFGPLNQAGGERRLNVAVTRAREKVVLVSSIRAADIDLSPTSPLGVLTLHHYLNYADKGPGALDVSLSRVGGFESPLDEDVAVEIQRMGLEVAPQVGYSGYRIDLGVVDPDEPGQYLLGVEFDGVSYRSAHNARDRDRLRHEILEKQGWKIHRIWSPSWVARRATEVRRLKLAIERARKARKEPPRPRLEGSEKADPLPKNDVGMSPASDVQVQRVEFKGIEEIGTPYMVSELKAEFSPYIVVRTSKWPYKGKRRNEFHLPSNRQEQCRLLGKLVAEEGPVHREYAAQRLADAWGLRRAGSRVIGAVGEAVQICMKKGLIRIVGDFLWPPGLRDVGVRVPVSGEPFSFRRIEYIPPEEIEGAMRLVVHHAMSLSAESLLTETARIFGFDRTGSRITTRLLEIYKRLLEKGELVSHDGIVSLPKSRQ